MNKAALIVDCTCAQCGRLFQRRAARIRGRRETYCTHECYEIKSRQKGNRTIHGHAQPETPTYRTWAHMRSRCNNPNSKSYPRYGERGISVCERWNSYEAFFADMGERPKGTSLDRKDSTGNYMPENCRWSTPKEQQNNRLSNHRLTHEGKTLTISEWGQAKGVNPKTISARLKRGWDVSRALAPTNQIERRAI